ncbi:MAG: succinylglutamate desuccinylase/aspartoacylase family protein [Syntrophomonadaceae bacterium]|nr:succinylglutamate desuccinylase/aspartoacylase family protein [Syntrophomonadaceae bacterium]
MLEKVGKTLIHISIVILLSLFTISTVFADFALAGTSSLQVLSKETIATGTKYATDLFIIRSSNPGPVVMVVGGVHGNETAGYKAATLLKDYRIKNGTLLILPQANRRAVKSDVRFLCGEKDLNRCFPQSSSESADNILAKEIYRSVKKYKVDWLMDMHEGINYSRLSTSVGQSIVYYPDTATRKVSQKIIKNLNKNISTSYKKFDLLTYPTKGSLARASAQFLNTNSFILETCSRQLLSNRINYQLKASGTLLAELGMR